MRIGLIIYGSLKIRTGGYIYDQILVNHFERLGHEVEIISLRERSYSRNLFDNFFCSINSRIIRSSFDLLLQDGLCHPSLFIINKRLKKYSKFPIVSILHQVLSSQPRRNWQNVIYRNVERQYLASVDAFIFNSKTTRESIKNLIFLKQPHIIAYPAGDRLVSGASIKDIKSKAQTRGPLKLLFIGNVLPNKGLHQLIDVLAPLPAEKWHLTVVGSLSMNSKYAQWIETLINQKKLSGQINLIGSKNGPELTRYFSRSQVLLMPFSHEGFGIAYIEGMAFGLPAIGSSKGAAKEIIQHGHNGFLISSENKAAILNYLGQLYEDRDRLVEMSCAAFDTFKAHPKWEDTMELIHDFLCRLASGRSRLKL